VRTVTNTAVPQIPNPARIGFGRKPPRPARQPPARKRYFFFLSFFSAAPQLPRCACRRAAGGSRCTGKRPSGVADWGPEGASYFNSCTSGQTRVGSVSDIDGRLDTSSRVKGCPGSISRLYYKVVSLDRLGILARSFLRYLHCFSFSLPLSVAWLSSLPFPSVDLNSFRKVPPALPVFIRPPT
jgi:hypothetical protein